MNRGSKFVGSMMSIAFPASMRPRFMNRGSAGIARRRPGPAARFNEAPIHESGKYEAVDQYRFG